MKAYSVIVTGKVQGVGFRRSVQQKVWELGIVGEAENLDDGSVQILAQGEDEQLGEFVGSLRTIELPAVVKNVSMTPIRVLKGRKNFKIKLGSSAEELNEGMGAGQEQLILLRKEFSKVQRIHNLEFHTLANRYDKISEALDVLTQQTKQFTDALTTLTQLAKDYFDERRGR